jgi:predicted ATPase/transcriptional regulator with XRE-family HTH domain
MTAERTTPLPFAELLQRFRQAAGLTQSELADRARLSPGTISDLERGVYHAPRRTTVALLADALRLDASDRRLFESAIRRSRNATSPPASIHPSFTFPAPLTRLVGREAEIDAVIRLIQQEHARLVTLTGTAGIGKTRLALAVASQLRSHFPDDIWFVPLASVQDPALIPKSIANSFGLQETGEQSLVDLIPAFLAGKRALLVLDNVEHLLDGVSVLVDLLSVCPHLALLTTSRTALRVRGEQRFAVPPLEYGAERSAAETLFIERAREVHPLLPVTPANLASIAAICRRVDGIPLAIELAAMRVATFAPPDLLRHLNHRLALLVGGPRDLPARQQTMRNAITWSYDLLAPAEQAIFRQLAVFVGGWTIEAARAVSVGEVDQNELLMALAALVDTSLIQKEMADEDSETRFTMLEILREYGMEQLEQQRELEDTQRRHAEYMLALARQAEPELKGPDQATWLARLEHEHGNLRAALHWAKEHDIRAGLQIAVAIWRFWLMRGHFGEGRSWLETFMQYDQEQEDLRRIQAHAYIVAGVLAAEQGNFPQAERYSETGLQLYQVIEDKTGICSALVTLGSLAYLCDRYGRAEEWYRQALTLCRAIGDRVHIPGVLNNLAVIATAQGRYHEAQEFLEEGLIYPSEIGDHYGIAVTLVNLSNLFHKEGKYARATTTAKEALAHAEQTGNRRTIASALENVGKAACDQGNYHEAIVALERGRQMYQELHDGLGNAAVLRHLGDVARAQGDWQQAEAYYRASIEESQQAGTAMGIAKCLAGWALVLFAQGQTMQSAYFASKAAAMYTEMGIAPQANISVRLEQTKRAIHQALGDEAFQATWNRGKTLSLDDLQNGSWVISLAAPPEMNGQSQPHQD